MELQEKSFVTHELLKSIYKKTFTRIEYKNSLDSIINACSIDETFYETKESLELQNDIRTNPDDKFTLIEKIDDSALKNKSIELTDDQFYEIIEKIDKKLLNKKEDSSTKQLRQTICLCKKYFI